MKHAEFAPHLQRCKGKANSHRSQRSCVEIMIVTLANRSQRLGFLRNSLRARLDSLTFLFMRSSKKKTGRVVLRRDSIKDDRFSRRAHGTGRIRILSGRSNILDTCSRSSRTGRRNQRRSLSAHTSLHEGRSERVSTSSDNTTSKMLMTRMGQH